MPWGIAETIGAAATAAQIGTGVYNATATAKTNSKTRVYNERMWERQRDLNLENWHRQNEYNSPKNQMSRYKDAGLNPHLIYGNGSNASNAGSIDSANLGSYNPQAPNFDEDTVGKGIQSFSAVKQMGLQQAILRQNLKNEEQREHLLKNQAADAGALAEINSTKASSDAIDLSIKQDHNAQGLVETNERDKKTIQSYEVLKRQEELHWQRRFNEADYEAKQQLIEELKAKIKNLGQEYIIKSADEKLAQMGINPNAGNFLNEYWQQLRKFFKVIAR